MCSVYPIYLHNLTMICFSSSLVLSALKVALDEKRKFHVIVVDSLPWLEGREMLRRLVDMGVQCSYVHLSAASFVMRQVSRNAFRFIYANLLCCINTKSLYHQPLGFKNIARCSCSSG